MKTKYTKIILIIVSFFLILGCSTQRQENKDRIFLDFYLGMQAQELMSQLKIMEDDKNIFTMETEKGTAYYYDFILKGGQRITAWITFHIEDEELNGIKLKLGTWTGEGFWHYSSTKKINEVFKLYIEKYGVSVENELELHYQVWNKNNTKIVFSKGSTDILQLNQEKAYVEYKFTDEYKELVNQEQQENNKKDI